MSPKVRRASALAVEPLVEVFASQWIECVVGLACFTRSDTVPAAYEIGPAWFDEIERSMSPALREALAPFRSLSDAAAFWFGVVGVAVEGPATVDEVLDRLAAMPAERLWPYLVRAHHLRHPTPAALEAVAAAGRGTVDPLVRDLAGQDRRLQRFAVEVATRLGADAGRAKALVMAAIRGWHAEVFAAQWPELAPVLERDAGVLSGLRGTAGPADLYERATAGGEYVQEAGVDRVVLVPTFLGRPWVWQERCGTTLLVCHPVAEESLAPSPEEARLRRILRLSRALSDESRLRILRRLADTPSTLQELADHFGLRKSTMHHHLSALRGACLLRLRMADKRYMLRTQPLSELTALLSEHLGVQAGPGGGTGQRRRR